MPNISFSVHEKLQQQQWSLVTYATVNGHRVQNKVTVGLSPGGVGGGHCQSHLLGEITCPFFADR